MMKDQVIIEVRGGVVAEVYGSRPDLEVIIVDWDEQQDRGPREICPWRTHPEPLSALPRETAVAAANAR